MGELLFPSQWSQTGSNIAVVAKFEEISVKKFIAVTNTRIKTNNGKVLQIQSSIDPTKC